MTKPEERMAAGEVWKNGEIVYTRYRPVQATHKTSSGARIGLINLSGGGQEWVYVDSHSGSSFPVVSFRHFNLQDCTKL